MHFHIDHISIKGCLYSESLQRQVDFRIVAPATFWKNPEKFPVLLMNDGQDFEKMNLEKTLATTFATEGIKPFIYVGISAGNRLQEYGTACCSDFKGRGARAKNYNQFILKEMIPFLKKSSMLHMKRQIGFSAECHWADLMLLILPSIIRIISIK